MAPHVRATAIGTTAERAIQVETCNRCFDDAIYEAYIRGTNLLHLLLCCGSDNTTVRRLLYNAQLKHFIGSDSMLGDAKNLAKYCVGCWKIIVHLVAGYLNLDVSKYIYNLASRSDCQLSSKIRSVCCDSDKNDNLIDPKISLKSGQAAHGKEIDYKCTK